jgi:hypothetical protein
VTTLTYHPSKSGTLLAAYCGECRVGYVESRGPRWLWQLSIADSVMLNFGREDDEVAAKEALESTFDHWLASAGLQHR